MMDHTESIDLTDDTDDEDDRNSMHGTLISF